ncbi:hypothetical protein QLQ12_04440 [Actinoplanes sp. NEAU-A12]|uniref:Integral membrane protein n=1 Tax=Actinoplanes sandaracinus TaxID=3045177 RepID=A0ABT6WDU0_9ACTN|nr:hypothetical protein [Actinoplanes sandaracinus]MDI6097847.1 hypothetical protein [Actinoplanes sandaracinus]
MTSLELRYRRLLRVYPAGHRAAYEDEMIGVLMSGAEPGRRFPAAADTLDLLRAGLTARLGQGLHTQRGTGWRAAATVTGLFAALVLSGVAIGRLADGLVRSTFGDPMRAHGVDGLALLDPAVLTATWLVAAAAAVLGLRRAAVAIAAAGVLFQAGTVAWWAQPAPWEALGLGWSLALAVVALGLFAASGPPVRAVLGNRGLALVMATAAAVAVAWVLPWTGVISIDVGTVRSVRFLVPLPVLAVAAMAAGRGVRGRIAVLSAVVVAIPVAFSWLEEAARWSLFFDLTPGIVASSVIVLLLTPIVVLAAGVTLLSAWERLADRGHGHVRAYE